MAQKYWLEELLSNPRDFIDHFFYQGKYYKKIRDWDKRNKTRKNPKRFLVFTLEEGDAKRNATFSTYEFGIKQHMIARGYLTKTASLLPISILRDNLLKLAGVVIEEDVFIAPEVTIDPVLRGWTRFRKGSSIGWGVKCFNHLFEENGRIIVGYIEVGEESSIGGFVSIAPGVTIGKKANIGAEVKIAPGVTVCDNAKIGAGSLLTPFVTIGESAEVTMGSVVTTSVEAGYKVGGNPAKVIIENKKPKLDLIINPDINKEDKAL